MNGPPRITPRLAWKVIRIQVSDLLCFSGVLDFDVLTVIAEVNRSDREFL